jgi:hypothetical protein
MSLTKQTRHLVVLLRSHPCSARSESTIVMSIFIGSKPVAAVFNTAEQPSYISSRLCSDLGLTALDHGTLVNVTILFMPNSMLYLYAYVLPSPLCARTSVVTLLPRVCLASVSFSFLHFIFLALYYCTLAINSAARDFLRKSRKSENSKEN